VVVQLEFLRVLCANQKTLTAKGARKSRKVREEIQIEPLLALVTPLRKQRLEGLSGFLIRRDSGTVDGQAHQPAAISRPTRGREVVRLGLSATCSLPWAELRLAPRLR